MTPTIRPITEEEKPLAEALYRNAFKISTELSQRWTSLNDLSTTRAIIDNGRVLSILTIKPFEVWIGGQAMKMGGISGVATWADQQGKGYAGMLVRQAISDMGEMGYPFSILYPFSFDFYGRFGYALANEYITYLGTAADVVRSAADDRYNIRPVNFESDMPAVKQLYRDMAPRWNTMVVRDDNRWANWQEYWLADNRQVYLVEQTTDGAVVGYFDVMDNALPDGGFESTVTELMFQSDAQYPVLARFINRLPGSIKKVKVIAPVSPRLWYMFQEPRVETKIHASCQARIIDVALACAQRGYEEHVDEEVCFTLTDSCAGWNSGPWRLRVKNGRGEISSDRNVKEPLLALDIRDFSAIFIGYKKATDLAKSGAYTSQLPELQAMDRIFHDRETRLLDRF